MGWMFLFCLAAFDLLRIRNLQASGGLALRHMRSERTRCRGPSRRSLWRSRSRGQPFQSEIKDCHVRDSSVCLGFFSTLLVSGQAS